MFKGTLEYIIIYLTIYYFYLLAHNITNSCCKKLLLLHCIYGPTLHMLNTLFSRS